MEEIILILQILIFWKLFSKRKIILVSPIFRNTETKELGGWAELSMKIPCFPFPGLTVCDVKGVTYKIREIQLDKTCKTIRCHTYYHVPIYEDNEGYEKIKKRVTDDKWKLQEVPSGYVLDWWKEEYER